MIEISPAARERIQTLVEAEVVRDPALRIELKYFDGAPVIREIKRVSKPGRRVYMGVRDIPQVRGGLGVSIVSTPKGVMSDAHARAANVGGEVICTVF